MNIDWGALGEVFVVSFGAAIAVIVLFSMGIRALAGSATNPTTAPGQAAGNVASRPALAGCCFPRLRPGGGLRAVPDHHQMTVR